MSTPFGNSLVDSLIEAGEKDSHDRLGESMDTAAKAVGRVLAAVKNGKLDVSVLENLAQWAENPTQSVNGTQSRSLGSGDGSSDTVVQRFATIAKNDMGAANGLLEMFETLAKLPDEEQRKARALGALRIIEEDIKVNKDGTPEEVARLRTQVTTIEGERDQAKKDLANERDESVSGSLAAKLKNASTPPAPADMVKKADLVSVVDGLGKTIVGEKTSLGSTKVTGHDDVVKAFNGLANQVGGTKLT